MTRELQNVRRQNVSNIVRAVWQQATDRSATSVRVIEAVALDDETPSLIERRLIIGRISA